MTYFLVKPDPVHIDHFLPSEKFGCNRRVQWQPIDTGTCPVKYNIQFRDNGSTIVGSVTGVKNNVNIFCTDDYSNSSSVTMWASHNGINGNKSQVELFHDAQKQLVAEAEGMLASFFIENEVQSTKITMYLTICFSFSYLRLQ